MGEYIHHIVAFALHLHWAADTPEPAQLHSRLHREQFLFMDEFLHLGWDGQVWDWDYYRRFFAWRLYYLLERGGFGFGMNLTAYLDLGILDWELCMAYYRLRMWMDE
jgi:hypothetical protein